jgi:hypothetical protein
MMGYIRPGDNLPSLQAHHITNIFFAPDEKLGTFKEKTKGNRFCGKWIYSSTSNMEALR